MSTLHLTRHIARPLGGHSSWLLALAVATAVTIALAGCNNTAPPRFPHRRHLTSTKCGGPDQPTCPSCNGCHDQIANPGGRTLPTASTCSTCHGPKGGDLMAAEKRRVVRFRTKRTITFEHSAHLGMAKISGQCVKCHDGVPTEGAKGSVYPPMRTCIGCHDEDFKLGRCRLCHQSTGLSKLVPKTFLRHDFEFVRNHGTEATRYAKVCSQCHNQKVCADCHDQSQPLGTAARRPDAIDRGVNHRGDYLSRHPIEARLEPARCTTCHTPRSCQGCHLERGVSASRSGSAMPHPRGWVGPDTESPSFHGKAARRDILTCAACHDQGPATNCIRCHRPGGPGGNPHPNGWSSPRDPSSPMCAYCHDR